MTKKETLVLRCAHADLVGVLQAREHLDLFVIDLHSIKQTLSEIEELLPSTEFTDWQEFEAK